MRTRHRRTIGRTCSSRCWTTGGTCSWWLPHHPDVAAIRLALSKLEGYTTNLALPTALPGDLTDVDLVVLHGARRRPRSLLRAFLDRCQRADMPLLVAVTSTTDLNWLGTSGSGVSVTGVRPGSTGRPLTCRRTSPCSPWTRTKPGPSADLPPPWRHRSASSGGQGADVLLKQRIGMVRTDRPLLALRRDGAARKATIVGEGLALAFGRSLDAWQHGPFRRPGAQHRAIPRGAYGPEPVPFEGDDLFSEDEPVRIEAELYNAS